MLILIVLGNKLEQTGDKVGGERVSCARTDNAWCCCPAEARSACFHLHNHHVQDMPSKSNCFYGHTGR